MAPRRRRNTDKLTEARYTERALADATRIIPRIVYLPARFRGHNQHLTLDNLQVRITGAQIVDNHARIQEADPLGFMIAKMHGLPIPRFEIECGAPGCLNGQNNAACPADHADHDPVIRVQYHTPSFQEQEHAAKWLASRVTFRAPGAYKRGTGEAGQGQHAHDYEAMIRAAAARAAEHPDTPLPDDRDASQFTEQGNDAYPAGPWPPEDEEQD